ncbi:MAG: hypothetical protein GX237_06655 [Clostridiales bacterium]|nr:hypothetical protein [Clostridiales bacterium]
MKGKKVILYSHGLISEADYNDIITRSVGNQLKDSDFQSIYLGGELDVESLGFLNRAMLKQIAKENNLDPLHPNTLNEESYQKLTTMINDKI